MGWLHEHNQNVAGMSYHSKHCNTSQTPNNDLHMAVARNSTVLDRCTIIVHTNLLEEPSRVYQRLTCPWRLMSS